MHKEKFLLSHPGVRPVTDKLNFCMLSLQSGNYELIGKAHQILRSASDRNSRIQRTETNRKRKLKTKQKRNQRNKTVYALLGKSQIQVTVVVYRAVHIGEPVTSAML